ncbi:MAG: hypothetical protein ACRYGK_17715 [Janthinobacterium lividum]
MRFTLNGQLQPPAFLMRALHLKMRQHLHGVARELAHAAPLNWLDAGKQCRTRLHALMGWLATTKTSAAIGRTPQSLQSTSNNLGPGHDKGVRCGQLRHLTQVFLDDPSMQKVFDLDHETFITMAMGRQEFKQLLLDAATWRALLEPDVEDGTLSASSGTLAPDRSSDAGAFTRIDGAGPQPCEACPGPQVMALIQPLLASGARMQRRSIAVQFVDLMNRIAAMAGKAEFRKDCHVDGKKILAAIEKDLRRNGCRLDPKLAQVAGTICKHQLDMALNAATSARADADAVPDSAGAQPAQCLDACASG